MSVLRESGLTFRLAFPLMVGQLSQMLLGVADTVMVGRLGVTELAALTFANSLFHVPLVFGMGVLTGVSVFTSNARGAGDAAAARASCRHGLYLAVALGVALFAVAGWLSQRLELFGQPPDVARQAKGFFLIIMASVIPALASLALKNHADALNRPWPPFWIFLSGVVLNVFLNWVLIYGKFGLPALGMEGSAWATLAARTAILVAMVVWLLRAQELREWVPYRWFRKPEMPELQRLLLIGTPASLHMLCEVGCFSTAGLMMGRFGAAALAAHQVAITCAATAFMIPLGLAMALTVRIGEAHGGNQSARLRPIALSGWLLGTVYALCAALFFLVCGRWLAGCFIRQPEVIELAASLLVIVGVFQWVDTLQVSSASMLRGLHDARVPAILGFIAYWAVGLPLAMWLAFGRNLGAVGVWWGLAAGLAVACLALAPRLWRKISPAPSIRQTP